MKSSFPKSSLVSVCMFDPFPQATSPSPSPADSQIAALKEEINSVLEISRAREEHFNIQVRANGYLVQQLRLSLVNLKEHFCVIRAENYRLESELRAALTPANPPSIEKESPSPPKQPRPEWKTPITSDTNRSISSLQTLPSPQTMQSLSPNLSPIDASPRTRSPVRKSSPTPPSKQLQQSTADRLKPGFIPPPPPLPPNL